MRYAIVGIGSLDAVSSKIEKRFGLELDQQREIQRKNDCRNTPSARRKSILKYLDTIE